MFEAEFTTEAATRPVCQRCKVSFPPGTKLYYMHSRNPAESGRSLCEECHTHYLQKGTTRRRDVPPVVTLPSSILGGDTPEQRIESHSSVRRHVAAAQRGVSKHAVVPIGTIGQPSAQVAVPAPVQVALPCHELIPGRQYKYNTINVVAPANTSSSLPFPSTFITPLINPGYQEAHQLYEKMRKLFQDKAYSTAANAEVITAKFWMKAHVTNKKNPITIASIFEVISNIPVHIGVHDLKRVAYHALLPHFDKWSNGFPLQFDQCTLRDKNWVELIPRHPDVDAVADKFFDFRGKNKATKVFSAKNGVELYLAIARDLYESIQEHIETAEAKKVAEPMDYSCFELLQHPKLKQNGSPIKSPKKAGKKRKMPNSIEAMIIVDNPQTNITYIQDDRNDGPLRAPSPDTDKVRRALEFQVQPRRKNMKLLFDTVTISLKFFRLPKVSFNDLVNNYNRFREPQGFESMQIDLNYNPSAKASSGGFKIASFGYTSVPIFSGRSNKVCFKQCYTTTVGTVTPQIYQGIKQLEALTIELNCIGWASALMDIVYNYMEIQRPTRGWPPFEVPQMRFVQAGLAISNDKKAVYLIEEFIDSETTNGGWFTKYLDNRSAIPKSFSNKDRDIRAEFLSFCQHFQYWKMEGLVFVSDFQGGRDLLTDPQVITAPELGHIFADGNTNFDAFTRQHACNQFCTFYGLPKLEPSGGDISEVEKSVVNTQANAHLLHQYLSEDNLNNIDDDDLFPLRI